MARGFESKSVTAQQEETDSLPRTYPTAADGARRSRRRRLELSRTDVERRLAEARAEPHREMLRRALAALDEEIAALG
jgi:hypothetical protein